MATTLAPRRVSKRSNNRLRPTSSAIDRRVGYPGKLFDDKTGLQNNLNRWYEPATGKWLSVDPIGFKGGDENLYRYVKNRAINATDPIGLVNPEMDPSLPQTIPGYSVTAKPTKDEEIKEVQKALETLCNCPSMKCPKDACIAEAKAIAIAYVDMFYKEQTISRPILTQNDYRCGWMCYQWQTHTFNALEPVVTKGKCFNISRVGLIQLKLHLVPHHCGGPGTGFTRYERVVECILAHNWVAITASGQEGGIFTKVPTNKCTVYLDPWKGESPKAYCFSEEGKCEDGHPCHNFVGNCPLGNDPKKPSGMGGMYKPSEGDFEPRCFDGWKW
jgi:RHS repeat-associated protein